MLDVWVSQQTAIRIKALQQMPFKTPTADVDLFIQAFDQQKKVWYDALIDSGPMQTSMGTRTFFPDSIRPYGPRSTRRALIYIG